MSRWKQKMNESRHGKKNKGWRYVFFSFADEVQHNVLDVWRQEATSTLSLYFFINFYNLFFTPVELPAWLMLVYQLHSCTFCTEAYLHRCLPKFLFGSLWTFLPKWTITIRKQILAERMHERCFDDRTVIWTLTLRHAICFLLPWDTQWIVTLCVL